MAKHLFKTEIKNINNKILKKPPLRGGLEGPL
jgi:hypothetical protein